MLYLFICGKHYISHVIIISKDIPHMLTLHLYLEAEMFKQLLNIKRNINECNFAVMKEFAAKKFLRFFSQNEHTTQHKNF